MTSQTPYVPPKDGGMMGAALGVTVYGLMIVVVSLITNEDIVPRTPLLAVAVLIGTAIVGAVLGKAYERVRN